MVGAAVSCFGGGSDFLFGQGRQFCALAGAVVSCSDGKLKAMAESNFVFWWGQWYPVLAVGAAVLCFGGGGVAILCFDGGSLLCFDEGMWFRVLARAPVSCFGRGRGSGFMFLWGQWFHILAEAAILCFGWVGSFVNWWGQWFFV